MKQHLWKDDALCLGSDTNMFFDTYEEKPDTREFVDSLCRTCPMARKCSLSIREIAKFLGAGIE